jgi:hypothetical protein
MSSYTPIDVFDEKYTPIKNHLDANASFNGVLFETYGKELEFVRQQPADRIWTWIDGEDGTYLVQGYAFVNRIGYIITKEPYRQNETQEYLVDLYSNDD